MIIPNSREVRIYHGHFDIGITRTTTINFKQNFLLHTDQTCLIELKRLDQNNMISIILNKAYGNTVWSKKYQ